MNSETRTVTRELTLRILCRLQHGPARFNELARLLDAPSPPLLSKHLKKLMRDGIVERHVHQLGPPAITSYLLTDLGRSMLEPATAMLQWVDNHRGQIETAREMDNMRRIADAAGAHPRRAAVRC